MMSALNQQILHWESYFQQLGWFGVLAYALLIVAVQMACAPLSPLAIAAGLIFGQSRGWMAVTIGTALGAALNFLLARYLARAWIARWLGGNEKFRLIDAAIGREGWKIVALLRLCPIPFGLANYSYGLTAVAFWPYLAASVLTIIPANLFFVWFGATSHDALLAVSGAHATPPGQIIFTVIGLVAFFAALTYVNKVARRALAQKDVPAPETALLP